VAPKAERKLHKRRRDQTNNKQMAGSVPQCSARANDPPTTEDRMHQQEQICDYVLEPRDGLWHVRMAGAEEYLSQHNSETEAKAAIKRYQAGDKRRAR
jgi:hypothetical protein